MKPSTFAQETAKSLHASSIKQIIDFLRKSARYDLLTAYEQFMLDRCADDLETILKWRDE